MADIVIRGMEMPNSCDDCPLVDVTENYYGDIMSIECNLIYKGYTSKAPKGGRLPDCPLVPLPEGHGRLVDEDEIKTRMTRKMYACKHNSVDELTYAVCIDIVDHADTIIEAEGGREMIRKICGNCTSFERPVLDCLPGKCHGFGKQIVDRFALEDACVSFSPINEQRNCKAEGGADGG